MNRRRFLSGVAALPAAAATYVPKRKYKVVIIGHTGRGNYGHGWDAAWNKIPQVEVSAVSDPNNTARAKVMAACGAKRGYQDFREMVAKEKPDIVTIGPRWADQRVEMVKAAADAKAHVIIEKPYAKSVADGDLITTMLEKRGLKAQVGHPARVFAVSSRVREMLQAGELGQIQELRGRGKEDRRAGGEDMIVLGSHVFDLMRYFVGDPKWVFAHATQGGEELRRDMMKQGGEPVGLLGGDDISAMFGFDNGVTGYFGSKRSPDTGGRRFGLSIAATKGLTYLPLANVPSGEPYLLRAPAWAPEKGEAWERVKYPEGTDPKTREGSNHLMALDLIEAIETGRDPICSARDGLWTLEMVAGVYQSQFAGKRVELPLKDRTT